MATLVLRLAGPMQAWGTESRWEIRDTGREPSKSGVVGLLAAALGRAREERVDDLARLRMAVRVEREGLVKKDYQTAMGIVAADGRPDRRVVSTRYYLSDAEFLVGLEGTEDLLKKLEAATYAPVYPLYLGRKSYLPVGPSGYAREALPIHESTGGSPPPGLGTHLRDEGTARAAPGG